MEVNLRDTKLLRFQRITHLLGRIGWSNIWRESHKIPTLWRTDAGLEIKSRNIKHSCDLDRLISLCLVNKCYLCFWKSFFPIIPETFPRLEVLFVCSKDFFSFSLFVHKVKILIVRWKAFSMRLPNTRKGVALGRGGTNCRNVGAALAHVGQRRRPRWLPAIVCSAANKTRNNRHEILLRGILEDFRSFCSISSCCYCV